jgi:hypothetical protein
MILGELSSLDWSQMTMMPDLSVLLASVRDLGHQGIEHTTILAQNYSNIQKIDIIADFQNAFQNFIKSGQVWALGIGLVVGWVLHSFIGS